MMSTQSKSGYEGLLNKYTNAMKGWQYRWFTLSPETGELHYFLQESEKNLRPRCSVYLAGAVIAPSDEDSNSFIVNSAKGEMLKLRATDARARQEWVDKLRAVAEIYTRAIANTHPPLSSREHTSRISTNNGTGGSLGKMPSSRSLIIKLEVLDAFANCREQLNKAKKENQNLERAIEISKFRLDPGFLMLKGIAYAMMCSLNQCLDILYQ